MDNNALPRHVWPLVLICLLLFVGVGQAQPGSTAQANPELVAAREAVEAYFRAADSGNPDAVRKVFHDDGSIEGVLGGKFVSWSADEFANRNFKGEPPAFAATIQRKIDWLDLSGSGAIARVTVKIGPDKTYTDYFILFKLKGEWKVGRKVFANE